MKKSFLLLILLISVALVGCSNEEAQAEVDGEVVNLEKLYKMIDDSKEELNGLSGEISAAESDLRDIEMEFKNRESEFSKLSELAENQESVKEEVKEAEASLDNLNSQIEDAESKLGELEGKIVSVSDEPIKINAGYFYFGSDVEPGRYELRPQEGQYGNVFIRRGGSSYVAETFGSADRGALTDFVFEAQDGDEIEATIPILLYPVDEDFWN
ncbi:hypothetical protein [Oceanobacillus sp. FSL W7-1309]|uniref:hypothetical protein n=1 Tax=Oceanobacillus sp. FSL W7-1309 TaxID=2954539 RepID=UPI0030FC8D65